MEWIAQDGTVYTTEQGDVSALGDYAYFPKGTRTNVLPPIYTEEMICKSPRCIENDVACPLYATCGQKFDLRRWEFVKQWK